MESIKGVQPFVIRHKVAQEDVKKEDVVFVREMGDDSAHDLISNQFSLFCLCDGHQGVQAANFVRDSLWNYLVKYMPSMPPPFDFTCKVGMKYTQQVRKAITLAFIEVDKEWQSRKQISGCTVTAAIVTGQLLTIANVGDSRALLVQYDSHHQLTIDHRVNDNKKEQHRLKLAGAHVTRISASLQGPAGPNEIGLGPLRVWPGGLCTSRSVGDIDVGPIILPAPYIKQVVLPENGARLVIASDGLWDVLSSARVGKISRFQNLETLGDVLINFCKTVKFGMLIDDTSILTVDFLPDYQSSFVDLMLKERKARRAGNQGGGFCFCGAPPVTSDEISTRRSGAQTDIIDLVIAEEDTSVHYNPLSGLLPEFCQESIKDGQQVEDCEDSDSEQGVVKSRILSQTFSANAVEVIYEEKAQTNTSELLRSAKTELSLPVYTKYSQPNKLSSKKFIKNNNSKNGREQTQMEDSVHGNYLFEEAAKKQAKLDQQFQQVDIPVSN